MVLITNVQYNTGCFINSHEATLHVMGRPGTTVGVTNSSGHSQCPQRTRRTLAPTSRRHGHSDIIIRYLTSFTTQREPNCLSLALNYREPHAQKCRTLDPPIQSLVLCSKTIHYRHNKSRSLNVTLS
jgi:hypothetical protein